MPNLGAAVHAEPAKPFGAVCLTEIEQGRHSTPCQEVSFPVAEKMFSFGQEHRIGLPQNLIQAMWSLDYVCKERRLEVVGSRLRHDFA